MKDMDSKLPQDEDLDLAVRVRADRLHLLYQQSYPAIFISVIVALLLCQVLWEEVRHELLIGWLAAICVSGVIRYALFWLHRRRQPEGLQILDWEFSYAVSLFMTALVWGLGVLWIIRESSLLYRLLAFMFLFGMSAGAFSRYSARRYMVVGAMASVLLPTTVWFLLSGQPMEVSLGVGALFFMAVLIQASTAFSTAQGDNFRLTHRLSAAKQRAELMAHTDELTGLENRRAFFDRGQTLANYCERNRLPLSVAMIDADHFKQINDRYGHAVGDAVLRKLADQLKCSLRKSDVCGRMGGEEFAMLLPDTSLTEATALAEKFCKSYAALPMCDSGVEVPNTVSIGVASAGYDIDHLLHCADEALYQAKAAGRNRVVFRADESIASS
jgi:diguanylate cyclase (GGDEF)-like protein